MRTTLTPLSLLAVVLLVGVAAVTVVAEDAPPAPTAPPQRPAWMPKPTPNDTLVSPEVQADRRVIFRLYAPSAKEVKLYSEGLESLPGVSPQEVMAANAGLEMTRGEDGVWSITFGPLVPGAYRYTFSVDGVRIADPRHPIVSQSLNNVQSLFEVPGAAFMEFRAEIPHGVVERVTYASKSLGALRRMHVYTPPGYGRDQARYPVFYLLHGAGDSDDAWTTVGRAGLILDNLIAEKKAVPMIVVMPAGHTERGFSFGSPGSMRLERFEQDLLQDVLPYVERSYRVLADRPHRAIAGLSMGGMQTLNVALTHPSLFAYIGVFSSGWFQPVREQFEQAHRAELESPEKAGLRLFWFGIGKNDFLLENSRQTIALLEKHGFKLENHETEGFHAWNKWRDYLYELAPRLFR